MIQTMSEIWNGTVLDEYTYQVWKNPRGPTNRGTWTHQKQTKQRLADPTTEFIDGTVPTLLNGENELLCHQKNNHTKQCQCEMGHPRAVSKLTSSSLWPSRSTAGACDAATAFGGLLWRSTLPSEMSDSPACNTAVTSDVRRHDQD